MSTAATTAATTAAIAAAQQARQREEEEEQLTPYTSEALAEDWEFKILRSAQGRFRDPAQLATFLTEEARAGWMLVEKFDDSRIRLKRPASAKAKDHSLDFDPYRIHVGISPNTHALIVVAITLAVTFVTIFAIVALVNAF